MFYFISLVLKYFQVQFKEQKKINEKMYSFFIIC